MGLGNFIQFNAGDKAVANDVNHNFDAITTWANHNVTSENLGTLSNTLQFSLNTNVNGITIANSGNVASLLITQSDDLAVGEGIITIDDEDVDQTATNASEFRIKAKTTSTIPAIWITHSSIDTLKLTKTSLNLFNDSTKISSDRIKLPIKTTTQRNAIVSPEEGSVIYNSITQQLNEKRSNTWVPVGCPVGSLLMYAGATAPEGWLLCIGSAVPNGSGTIQGITADFSTLYSIVGSTLPDLRGRIPLGKDDMGGSSANRVTNAQADTLLGSQGSETIAVTSLPNHTHIYSDSYFAENNTPGQGSRMPQDAHATSIPENKGTSSGSDNDNVGWSIYKTSDTNFSRSNGGFNTVTSSNLANDPHMPPYQTFNYIIKY